MVAAERFPWRRSQLLQLDAALRRAAAARETLHVLTLCKRVRHRSVAWRRIVLETLRDRGRGCDAPAAAPAQAENETAGSSFWRFAREAA